MPSPTKILYTAEAVSSGDGRDGHVTSSDRRIDLDLAFPPELGGSGDGSNPEHCSRPASRHASTVHCGSLRGRQRPT